MDATLYGRIVAGAALEPLRRRPGALPERELTRRGATIARDRLAAYDRVCGFRLGDVLPATYPHVLAFPRAMELMAAGDFPFGVLGLVHVANEIEQLRPLRADEALDLSVRAADLREHPRGRQFDVLAEASVEGEVVWRDRSTYLHREGGGGSSDGARERPDAPAADAVWDVPSDTGRRYAAVSGDSNPIHLHGLPARLFGQPGAIAHGMWSKARCLAALEGHVPDAFTVSAAFKLPIRLPAKVAFASWRDEDGARAFALHDARSGKPHLTGSLSPSAAAR
jgi:acyl dehydratase